jgi:hypothetical protein
MGNIANNRYDEIIMTKFSDLMKRIRLFGAAFKMMPEVKQEEFFDLIQRHDHRRYNLPRANEVAADFVGDNGEVPKYRHIVVHSYYFNRKLN